MKPKNRLILALVFILSLFCVFAFSSVTAQHKSTPDQEKAIATPTTNLIAHDLELSNNLSEFINWRSKEPTQKNLNQVRQIIETLQLGQLDNLWPEIGQRNKYQKIEEIDPQAAVIYTIILGNRLEIILSLPEEDLTHYTTELYHVRMNTYH